MNPRFLLLMALLAPLGCAQTGGSFVDVPFEARGTTPQTFVKNGWEVTLSQATLGFGAIFFCTTESQQSTRCEVAILEFRDAATLDGLDPGAQPIESLFGTTGTIRTAFFNYGIVWLLTNPVPEALSGAPGGPAPVPFENPNFVPTGHSARFQGTAVCVEGAAICCPDTTDCPSDYVFEANIDVITANRGTPTVNGVRTSTEITVEPIELTVIFDPNAWWQAVDFTRLAALDDGSGIVLLGPADPDYSVLIQAMTANQPPTFVWSSPSARE